MKIVLIDRLNPSSRTTAVSDHFLSDNHSPNGIELIPLELRHSSRDALRKAREAYLNERCQTLGPKERGYLILCLTHLYVMYYISFGYLVIY